MKWKIKHIKEIEYNIFNKISYLFPERLVSCKDILVGLSILNSGDYPSIMFLNTKSGKNIFVCFYCDDNSFELLWNSFNIIIKNHIKTLEKSKQNIERLKIHK